MLPHHKQRGPDTRRPRLHSALRTLITSEAGGGLILKGVAALALVVANSPLAGASFGTLKT